MRDAPRQTDFLLEAIEPGAAASHRLRLERLDGDRLLQLAVECPVHDAHAAGADHLLDLVAPGERGARPQLVAADGADRGRHRVDTLRRRAP